MKRARLIAFLALAYLAFVVYGSLVPLSFVSMPLEEALRRFREIQFLTLGLQGRADWVANLLLMVPLTFLWLAVLRPGRGRIAGFMISLLVWLGALAVAVAIEFTQVYFPQRTVSLNDILAEAIGATVGVLLWAAVGKRSLAWLDRWGADRTPTRHWERILWIYLGVLLLYNVMPLDLAPSPADLLQKWKAGRVVLVPFGFRIADPMQQSYQALTGIILWAPPAFLWVFLRRGTPASAWLATLGIAAAIEFLQLLVYSRVSDVTDVLLAAVGAGIGAALGSRFADRSGTHLGHLPERDPTRWIAASVMGSMVWLTVLVGVFWYPFDFHMERAWVESRLTRFAAVPFFNYYYTSEYEALTQALRRVLLFLPLGAAIGLGGIPFARSRHRWVLHAVAVMIVLAVAAGIEGGQVLLPEKYPDSTDLVLEALGGIAGYFGLLVLHGRRRPGAQATR